MAEQLPLFAPSEGPAPVGPATPDPAHASVASRLPPGIHLGTSSWAFPGWRNIVYDREASQKTLSRYGLEAYSQNPLFGAVAIDRTYYGPIPASEFRAYADQVPEGFRFLVKAHEALTRPGEHYLDRDYAVSEVIGPAVEGLGAKAAVLLLQFPPQGIRALGGPSRFAEDLGELFRDLPREILYAVELRNPELLSRRYLAALEETSACHCFNVHPSMPDVREQASLTAGARFPALVVRWMLRRDRDYEEAREDFRPFNRLASEDTSSREAIARLCREGPKPAFVIVNNKAEGSAPLSVFKLAEEISRWTYQAIP
jgi:uncharacterized protein YecE (DUF72 family)